MSHLTHSFRAGALSGVALLLSACDGPLGLDLDLRDIGDGFDTSEAAVNVAPRPEPDSRGVIRYPSYDVVVARRGDTVRTVADRLGLSAGELASYNGINPDVTLRAGEVIALPARLGDGTAPTAQPGSVDVTELAGAAIDRAGPTQTALPPAPAGTIATPSGIEPVRHQVQRGETIFSISRSYDVPVQAIADYSGLGPDLAVREGQYLLIPVTSRPGPAVAGGEPQPGEGSPTPTPPSAAAPLPEEDTTPVAAAPEPAPEAPDLSAPAAAASAFIVPVDGPIIRAYSKGRNDGIDIGAPAGTPVRASAAGTVAAVTENTDGAAIVVIRHPDNILTVYVNLADLSVAKGDSVSQGQTIATVPPGDPSFLHFEVREGLESADPADYLP